MLNYRQYRLVRIHSSALEVCRCSFEEAAIVGFHRKSVRAPQAEGALVACFAAHDLGNVGGQSSLVALGIESWEEVHITTRDPWHDAYKNILAVPPALAQYTYPESQHL
jgi:hypothetical protein